MSRGITSSKCVLSIVLFLLIFNPPISKRMSFTIAFTILGALYIVFNLNSIIRTISNSKISSFLRMLVLFLVYCSFSFALNMISNSEKSSVIFSNYMSLLSNNISICVVSIALMHFLLKKGYSSEDFLDIVVYAGLIQALIGILCFVSPSIKAMFNNLVIINSRSERIVETFALTSEYRNYGFASTLYDIFGCCMSIIALIALFRANRGKGIFYLAFLAISFVAIINARTSIILISIGMIIMIISSLKGKNSRNSLIARLMLIGIIITAIILVVAVLFGDVSFNNQWLNTGISEIKSLIVDHKATGYFDQLFNGFIFFPESTSSLLFGTGMDPAQAIEMGSDVGYIQDLWKYGIVGALIQYSAYLKLFRSVSKSNSRIASFGLVITIIVAIYLIKLNCLGYSMAAVVYLPIAFFALKERIIIKTVESQTIEPINSCNNNIKAYVRS